MEDVRIRIRKENMDLNMIHHFLIEDSYWAKGISYELVDNSLTHSFCIGAFIDGSQVGFGRVITDYYTFGWFADFFVLSEFRGKGVTKKMLGSGQHSYEMFHQANSASKTTRFGLTESLL